MLIERTERGLKIRTPAKLNLFLNVLGKRTDGYHQIDTIMCPVGLWDELELEPTDSPDIAFSLAQCHGQPARCGQPAQLSLVPQPCTQEATADCDPAWDVPAGDNNLVVRALNMVRETIETQLVTASTGPASDAKRSVTEVSASGHQGLGCRVRLTKGIPAAAGLGGGSSDAAAAIVAGLCLWSGWDRGLAVAIASRLGSDIPLFLGDEQNGIGLARATGRGEIVEMLTGRPPLCFVISHPPVGSSTAEVYKLWRDDRQFRSSTQMLELLSRYQRPSESEQGHRKKGSLQSREIEPAEQLRGSQLCQSIEPLMANALQRPASQLNEWIDKQLSMLARLGKPAAMMSGSGSACFALCSDLEEGRELVKKLIELGMPRAYAAPAWYAASIEQQLERITSEPVPTQ